MAPTIAVQLWSIDQQLREDARAALARIAAIGIATVEASDFVTDPATLKAQLDEFGLTAATGHEFLVSDRVVMPDGGLLVPPSLEETFAAARTLEMRVVIDPYVDPERFADLGSIERTAEQLNEAAAVAATFGLRVGYHNHNHEFATRLAGRTAFEHLVDHLDAQVLIELDLFWAAVAGADVIDLVTDLGPRLVAIHAKDAMVAEVDPSEGLSPQNQVAVGLGSVPIAAALAAAEALELAVIEFDAYPRGDVFEAIADSAAWLAEQVAA